MWLFSRITSPVLGKLVLESILHAELKYGNDNFDFETMENVTSSRRPPRQDLAKQICGG